MKISGYLRLAKTRLNSGFLPLIFEKHPRDVSMSRYKRFRYLPLLEKSGTIRTVFMRNGKRRGALIFLPVLSITCGKVVWQGLPD